MDVTCQRCGAKCALDAAEIGDAGADVRCASCGHTFRVFADPAGASEGPGSRGELAHVPPERWEGPAAARGASEPAWARSTAPRTAPLEPERPAARAARRRSRAVPIAIAVAVAGAVAAFFAIGFLGRPPEAAKLQAPPEPRPPPPESVPSTPSPRSRAQAAPPPAPSRPAEKAAPLAVEKPAAEAANGSSASAAVPEATPTPNANATGGEPSPAELSHPREPAPRQGELGESSTPTPTPTPNPNANANANANPTPNATVAPDPSSTPPERAERRAEGAVAAAKAPPPRGRSVKSILTEARRMRDRGHPEAALELYGEAIAAQPDNADALAGRGACYLDLSQYAPAEASFQAALGADAENGAALMGLAETFRYEGRRAEAVSYYERYLAAHPHGAEAVAARNAMQALKE